MTINQRMFTIMDDKSIKDAELARYIDKNKSVISTWRARGTNPPIEHIVQICELLGVSIEFFITGKESDGLSQDEQELIKAYRRATSKTKDAILASAKILAPEQDESYTSKIG